MATKTKSNLLKRAFPKADPAISLEGAAGSSVRRPKYEAGQYTAYGLFKGPEGMWILRVIEMDGDRVLRYHDNEPDIRAIQVGKVGMAIEGTEPT